MKNSYSALFPVILSLLPLSGCSSDSQAKGGENSASGGGNATGGSSAVPGSTSPAGTCSPGIPSTSQIPRMKGAAYDAVISDLLGVTSLASAGNAAPSSLLVPDYDGSMTDIAWNGYLAAARQIAAQVMAGASKSKFIACEPAALTCLTDTIKAFGRKAFRRPLADAEVTSFERLNGLTPKGTPAEVAEAILFAFLASPSFITLPELAQDKEGDALKLSSYEIATRLSFLLWGTVPDDALNAAADTGQLSSKEQISAQARRMLQSDRATSVVASFHHYYAGRDAGSHWVNNTDHDRSKFPSFSPTAYPELLEEIDAFFAEVVLTGGSFQDLFLSNVAFVSSATAALYGLDPASFGAQATRVELDAGQRPGFLTRAGFLSTFSSFDVTSPILRGAFVSGRVLGISPGNPDPNALKTPIPPGTYATRRQEIEALTGNQPCKGCHGTFINPAGFVLERYSAVGTWQDTDPLGGPIDGTADVYFSASSTKTITSPLELMTEIANLPNAQRHYAEQWVAFATGRVPNANDACTVDQLGGKLAQPGYPVIELIADFTQADSFRLRTLGN